MIMNYDYFLDRKPMIICCTNTDSVILLSVLVQQATKFLLL